ncbi:prepilin peptidase [Aquipuribacter hungaricus]|uniref:Prepilin leader peptidase/N-methyltransferase n=1 Tax=Aquipuribacter hungaricus TaxID=545624 RepID=A0ABV7WEM7_9MICO
MLAVGTLSVGWTDDPTLTTFAVVAAGLFGLLVGSFLNVVVHRVPRGLSVVRPPSACPGCGAPVRPRDNVPVLSWLLLRGRCRDCGEPISGRYPLVETATGLAFAGVVAAVLLEGPTPWVVPALLYLAAVSIALTLIDVDVHRLPDAIVLPSYPVLFVLLAVASAGSGDWPALLRAALGAGAGFGCFLLLVLVYPAGMGFGDVKLAGVLGMVLGWYGWGALVLGLFLGFLLGGVVGLAIVALGRGTGKTKIPFGPYMVVGAWLAVGFAAPVVDAYLRASGLR